MSHEDENKRFDEYMKENIEVKMTRGECNLLFSVIGTTTDGMAGYIDQWENRRDGSMDKFMKVLSRKMELTALQVKILIGVGAPEALIQEFMKEVG